MICIATLDSRVIKRFVWCCMLATAAAGCKSKPASRGEFDSGRRALQRGQFSEAIQELGAYLRESPRGELASRASFLIGKAQLGLGNHDDSRAQFEQTIRSYPNSEEAHKSRYKLAMLGLLDGDEADARRRFSELIDAPSGTLVPEATAMRKYLDRRAAEQAGDK